MDAKSFRADIEGLRGIAILLVLAYHYRILGFTGGFVGVDVFYVLSGYLITGLLVTEKERSGRIGLANFYARRARRLLPASAAMLFVVVIATYVLLAPYEQAKIFKTAISTAVYASNIHFLRNATDYLADPPDTDPLLHTWSLSVEEQFYFVFPLLLMLALRYGGRRLLFIVVSIGALISFVLNLFLTSYFQPFAFFSSPTRAWEFAAGALAVLITRTQGKHLANVIGWFGLVFILGSAIFFGQRTQFPGWAALLPILGTVAVLRSGPDSSVSRLLGRRLLLYFGRISYSLYLWHWVIFVFANTLLLELSLPVRLICILLSIVLAQISFTLVENPVRVSPALSRRPVFGLAMAGVLTLVSLSLSFTLFRQARANETLPENAAFYEARIAQPIDEGCHAKELDTTLTECVFDNPGSDKTVVAFGDSHMYQWFPAIEEIAKTENWRVVVLFKDACTPVDIEFFFKAMGRRFYECEQWRADAFARIDEIKPYLVIVSGYERVSPTQINVSLPMSTWVEGLERTFDRLNRSAAKVAYLRDIPHPDFNPLTCIARRKWQKRWVDAEGACTFDRDKTLNEDVAAVEKRVAIDKGVSYIDMTDYYCPGAICEPMQGDMIVYRDLDHLSIDFVRKLAGPLRHEFQKQGVIDDNIDLDR